MPCRNDMIRTLVKLQNYSATIGFYDTCQQMRGHYNSCLKNQMTAEFLSEKSFHSFLL